MALRIANPDNVPREVTTGYQAQNNVLYASMTGFVNMNMSRTGLLSEGSVVEVNGVLFKCIEDETLDNLTSIPLNSIFYIYAMPITDDIISFSASAKVPQWYTTKGGYYSNDNDRALIRAMKDANGAIVGATLMTNVLTNSVYANEGGIMNYSKNYIVHESIALDPGWYRFELCSGLGGGNGGAGGNGNEGAMYGANPSPGGGGYGGYPNTYHYNNNTFYHQSGNVIIHIGGNAGAGASGTGGSFGSSQFGSLNGGSGGGGGGGGGGAGEETYIISGGNKYAAGQVNAGAGGNGGWGTAGITQSGVLNNGAAGGGFQTYANDALSYIGVKGGNGGVAGTNPVPAQAGGNWTCGMDGFGSGGAGGGGGGQSSNYNWGNENHPAMAGGSGGRGGNGGCPGWFRTNGDGASGYCRIYYLGA